MFKSLLQSCMHLSAKTGIGKVSTPEPLETCCALQRLPTAASSRIGEGDHNSLKPSSRSLLPSGHKIRVLPMS